MSDFGRLIRKHGSGGAFGTSERQFHCRSRKENIGRAGLVCSMYMITEDMCNVFIAMIAVDMKGRYL